MESGKKYDFGEMKKPLQWDILKQHKEEWGFKKKFNTREFSWLISTLLVVVFVIISYAFILVKFENANVTVDENLSLVRKTRSKF